MFAKQKFFYPDILIEIAPINCTTSAADLNISALRFHAIRLAWTGRLERRQYGHP
jgi:hypothetical protein